MKQWCFAQSTPPTPGVFDNSTTEPIPASGSSVASSSDGERDLADEVLSPAVENHYTWWVGAGNTESSRPAVGNGWFNWSGGELLFPCIEHVLIFPSDINASIPRAAGVGVI